MRDKRSPSALYSWINPHRLRFTRLTSPRPTATVGRVASPLVPQNQLKESSDVCCDEKEQRGKGQKSRCGSPQGQPGFRARPQEAPESTYRCEVVRKCNCGSGDSSWWEYDGRGIPLARVCSACESEKMSQFRPEIRGTAYGENDVEEPIEEEA
tara:strand:- start:2556 stop:3017 length:462 start_codon:yes stop_codon:yes gene_type:complete